MLGWSFSPKGYAGMDGAPIPPELEVPLPDHGEILRPDLAVRELDPQDGRRMAAPGPAARRQVQDRSMPPPTAGWSGCCARRQCQPACCSTAGRYG